MLCAPLALPEKSPRSFASSRKSVGCDYQFAGSPWVIGVGGDILDSHIAGTQLAPEEADEIGIFSPPNENFTVKADFLASVTGRLGYSFWNTGLVYVKGGAAWANYKYGFQNATELVNTTFPNASLSESRTGWTLGGGIEWAFAPNWSARVEYAHYGFGTKSDSSTFTNGRFGSDPENPETFVATINQRIDTVTFGINYRFGVPFLARY